MVTRGISISEPGFAGNSARPGDWSPLTERLAETPLVTVSSTTPCPLIPGVSFHQPPTPARDALTYPCAPPARLCFRIIRRTRKGETSRDVHEQSGPWTARIIAAEGRHMPHVCSSHWSVPLHGFSRSSPLIRAQCSSHGTAFSCSSGVPLAQIVWSRPRELLHCPVCSGLTRVLPGTLFPLACTRFHAVLCTLISFCL